VAARAIRVPGARSVPRVGPGLLVSLIAGRGAFRVAMLGSSVALLPLWGQSAFADYASAMGRFAFVVPLVNFGVEKTALKLVPRAEATRRPLTAALLVASCILVAPFLLWLALAALLGWVSQLTTMAGLLMASLGLNQVLVAMHRALGRPRHDARNFFVLGVATAAATALVPLLGLRPVGFVTVLLAVTVALDLALLRGLRAPWREPLRARRMLARYLISTMTFMGVADVSRGASISVLFLILGSTRFAPEISKLYVTATAVDILLGVLEYVLRVFQPQVALALAHRGTAARRWARQLSLSLVTGGVAWLFLAFAAARQLDHVLARTPAAPPWTAVLLLFVACLPLFAAKAAANFLLENLDIGSLRLAAAASMAGTLSVALLGLAAAPRLGALGAVAAFAGGEVANGWFVLAGLRTASPQRGGAQGTASHPA
jgi:O-antigen/teichoic acid export membrane protein